jgi:c-di-GMP-related signal transduction protein
MHVYSVQYRARVYKSEISLLVQFSRTFVNTKEEALPSKLKREFPVSRVVLEKLLDMC